MYERIRNLCEDHDLTQTQVAKLVNVSRPTCSRYESGLLDIPGEALTAMAKYYGVSADCLLGLTIEFAPAAVKSAAGAS